MSLLLAMLIATASGYDPVTDAVMGPRKPPAERRMKGRPVAAKPSPIDPELEECVALARRDNAAGIARAQAWVAKSDGPAARQCLGFAQAEARHWPEAVAAFNAGARLAGTDSVTAARLWAQAGNAALAGNDFPAALSAIDKALEGGLPDGLARGEAYLDRARARVAMKDEPGARADLDTALRLAPQDPLAWLLSATLARRMDDLPLARRHIAQAVSLADDDAAVALEQGVIAALSGDDRAASAAFTRARTLAPGTATASAATAYLSQLDSSATSPVQTPQSR
jgi:tetratricopeptide (TPR) repeat protein